MTYLFFTAIVVFVIYYYLDQRGKINTIKYNGVKVVGTIIQNTENSNGQDGFGRLGGNINEPTIKFITKDGQEIIGKPVVRFVSQHEVVVPSKVYIIYDAKDPQKFFI